MAVSKSKDVDVSKQMDQLLGKPPVPVTISKRTIHPQEDELLNLRVKLQQKEKDIADKEKNLKKELSELENKVYDLKKERAELWKDLDSLARQKGKLEKETQDMREELKAHKKQIKYAEEINQFIAQKKASFEQKAIELKKREENIANKEKELSSINHQIKEKEKALDSISKMLQNDKSSFEKKRMMLLDALDVLEKKKILLSAQVSELTNELTVENKKLQQAMRDVKELYSAAEKKNTMIDKRAIEVERELDKKKSHFSSEIEKMHKMLDERENKLTKFALSLEKKDSDLRAREDILQKGIEDLEERRKAEASIRKAIIELTTEERMTEQALAQKKDQLNSIEMDYTSKLNELQRDRELLDSKEDEIVARIKQLEDDERSLAEKEEEFIDKINELEQDKILFDQKVEEFSNKLERVNNFDAEVAKKTEELRKREELVAKMQTDLELKEQKLIRNSEFKLNITALKREKEQLQRDIKMLQAKFAKKAEINKRFMTKERVLQEREKLLVEKENQLKQLLSDIASERDEMMTTKFGNYIEKGTGAEQFETGQIQAKDEEIKEVSEMIYEKNPKNYDAFSLIRDARQALLAQNIAQARKIYAKLNSVYKNLPKTQEKKKLYYEIMELKTDIELSMV